MKSPLDTDSPDTTNAVPPVRFLQTSRLYLRPLVASDANGAYPTWLNDATVCTGNSHHVRPFSREQAREYIDRVNRSTQDLVLAVVLKSGDVHIGNISLLNIHPVYRKAEFAILLGEPAYWGQGYGLEAAGLLIQHGFAAMNLLRIECGTFANNAGMQRLAVALGMKQEGVRRLAAYKDGDFVDVLEFGVLRDEFTARQKQ